MPGNEVSDRVHNFFEKDNLSQSQYHTQAVEGNWPVFNINPWGASDRQIGGVFTSKNYNTHQGDSGRGQGNLCPQGSYGLNFAHSNPRPELSKNQSQNQPPNLNGFIHAPPVFNARHNEANIMGMEDSDGRYSISRGLPTLDQQQRSGAQLGNSNSMSLGSTETPVSFDFLGNQQQMNGRHSVPLQSIPRQQPGFGDIQQMQQQQLMMKQMQELQRQQHFQQLQALQRNSLNQSSSFPDQAVNHHPSLISETPMHAGLNFPWSSQVMVGNQNWLQQGVPAAVQGYSNGVMVTPEQAQALRIMGFVPPQASQSLYGVPVSSPGAASPYLHGQMDKAQMQHSAVHSSSRSSDHQHGLLLEDTNVQERANSSRGGFENKNSDRCSFGPGSGDTENGEFFNQNQQRNESLQRSGGRQDLTGSSEILPEKTGQDVASSQASVALDPTEEKILFGSDDDNIWEAFGGSLSTGTGNGNHLDGALPSLQSGSWSALMQSAVAECVSNSTTPQAGVTGVGVQHSGAQAANMHGSISHDRGKHQAAWVDGSQGASLSYRHVSNDDSASYNGGSGYVPSFLNQSRESAQVASVQQSSEQGRNWLAGSQPQTPREGRQVEHVHSSAEPSSKDMTSSRSHQQNLSLQNSQSVNRASAFRNNESALRDGVTSSQAAVDRNWAMSKNAIHAGALSRHDSASNGIIGLSDPASILEDEAVIHNSSTSRVDQNSSQKLQENRNFNFWRTVSSAKSGCDVRGTGNSERRENSSDSHSSNISHHTPSGSFRDSVGSDIGNTHGMSGERQVSSHPSGSRGLGHSKFQQHSTGAIERPGEPAYEQVNPRHSEPIAHPLLGGLRSQEGQPMFFGSTTKSSLGVSNIQRDGLSSSSTSHLGYMSGESASDKPMSSSQNMLELFQKVKQSNEQNRVGQFGSSLPTGPPEGEAFHGTNSQQKQSPASQSFGLQLAPPSRGKKLTNFTVAVESSSQNAKSASLNAAPSAPGAFGDQSVNASNMPLHQPSHSVEPHSSRQQEQDYEEAFRRENVIASQDEKTEREVDAAIKSDSSLSKSVATQKEIEAFGRSLRPHNHSKQEHVQAETTEMGHVERELKRFEGSDIAPESDAQYIAGNSGPTFSAVSNSSMRNTSANSALVSSGETMMLSAPPDANNDQGTDKLSVGPYPTVTGTVPRVENPKISPQMAPTWFDQYGTLKNGQLLATPDARKSRTISSLQQQFMTSNSSSFVRDHSAGGVNVAMDTVRVGNSLLDTTTLVRGDQFSSPGAIAPSVGSSTQKKRKSATADLLPWHEEVLVGSQRVQAIRSAEIEWAQAAGRLLEKPGDETGIDGDMMLKHRSRSRLILTTKLMQQLLPPPHARVLSLDAESNYETVAYVVARLALGDACSMTCCSANDSHLDSENPPSERPITSRRIRYQYLAKLVGDFISRAKKLEDMSRLDKQPLMLDLRLDCQDQERLSIINRFAKFHGKGQADGTETSSSSNVAAITQKPNPQRYVIAHPMPMSVPDSVQCLTL